MYGLSALNRHSRCRVLLSFVLLCALTTLFINSLMNTKSHRHRGNNNKNERRKRDVTTSAEMAEWRRAQIFLNLKPGDVDPQQPCKPAGKNNKVEVRKTTTTTQAPELSTESPQPEDIIDVTPEMLEFSINPRKACRDPALKTIIYIHSAPYNVERRRTIRRTWGQRSIMKGMNAKILFVMGQTNDTEVNAQIQKEVTNFYNIIQGSFHDSYRNLTIKAIAAVKWVSTYCSHIPNVIKLDDDVVVNIFNLSSYITNATKLSTKNVIYCNVWAAAKVIRSSAHKHFVRSNEFTSGFYPPYCAGAAVFFSGDVIPKLYNATIGQPYFWLDDVYLTGILTNKSGLKLTDTSTEYKFEGTLFNSLKRNEEYQAIFTHSASIKEMYILWQFLKLRYSNDLMRSFYRLSMPTEQQKRLLSEQIKQFGGL